MPTTTRMGSLSRVQIRSVAKGRTEPVYERLSNQPALDGLRAVAVGGVLLYHQNPGLMPGGWLGVSLFFTLSGFLIGGIALAEHEHSRRIDILAFWGRRIRRLLPASCLALLIAIAIIFVNDIGNAGSVITDIRAAVLQLANWRFIDSGAGYAGLDSAPSPVQHYWSLAIEEQFYVVFPLMMAFLAARRKLLVPALVAVVVVGGALQFVFDDRSRIYFGTDTRAPEIAIGVLLAAVAPRLRPWCQSHGRAVDLLGLVGLASTLALFLFTEFSGPFVTSGALSLVGFLWGSLIVAVLWGRTMPRLLSMWPGPGLGQISYGIYLYHWPIYLVMTAPRTGLGGPALFAARAAATVVVAALSARFIENPIRHGQWTRKRTFQFAGAAVAGILVVTVAVPRVRGDDSTLLASGSFHPPTDAVSADSPLPRILISGDSTASALGLPMQEVATEEGLAEVFVRTMPGCTLLTYERALVRDGYVYDPVCPDIAAETAALVDQHDIDAVVLFLGTPQLMDLELDGMQGWHSIDEAEVAGRYERAAAEAMERLGGLGVPILWADVPLPMWDLNAFGDLVGAQAPGQGPARTNEPRRVERLNEIDARVATDEPTVARLEYAAALEAAGGLVPSGARADGLHLDPDFASDLARDVLFEMIEEAYRTVRERLDAESMAAARPTTWDGGR